MKPTPGRQAPRSRQINAPALAITGPTKPLRSSLTFRLRAPRNQRISSKRGGPIIRSIVRAFIRGARPLCCARYAFTLAGMADYLLYWKPRTLKGDRSFARYRFGTKQAITSIGRSQATRYGWSRRQQTN
jgi:hypothetical protein